MIKSSISKEQIANIVSNLSNSIQKLNLSSIDAEETNDPISDLERMHEAIFSLLQEGPSDDYTSLK